MRHARLCFGLAALVMLPVYAGGCSGGATGGPTFTGTVTCKGAPLTTGRLTLYKDKVLVRVYSIHPDGSFQGDAPEPGEYVVTVNGDPIEPGEPGQPVPAKYKEPATSGLKWTITAGNNVKNFAL